MTREERLAQHEKTVRAALKTQQDRLARIQAAQRAQERRAQNRRRHDVGTLAEQAGLCGWDDATLEKLFVLLATLRGVANPIGLLEGLLTDGVEADGVPVACVRPTDSLPHGT